MPYCSRCSARFVADGPNPDFTIMPCQDPTCAYYINPSQASSSIGLGQGTVDLAALIAIEQDIPSGVPGGQFTFEDLFNESFLGENSLVDGSIRADNPVAPPPQVMDADLGAILDMDTGPAPNEPHAPLFTQEYIDPRMLQMPQPYDPVDLSNPSTQPPQDMDVDLGKILDMDSDPIADTSRALPTFENLRNPSIFEMDRSVPNARMGVNTYDGPTLGTGANTGPNMDFNLNKIDSRPQYINKVGGNSDPTVKTGLVDPLVIPRPIDGVLPIPPPPPAPRRRRPGPRAAPRAPTDLLALPPISGGPKDLLNFPRVLGGGPGVIRPSVGLPRPIASGLMPLPQLGPRPPESDQNREPVQEVPGDRFKSGAKGGPYGKDEQSRFDEMVRQGATNLQIATELRRTVRAIESKRWREHSREPLDNSVRPPRDGRPYSLEEQRLFDQLVQQGSTDGVIALQVSRTVNSVAIKRKREYSVKQIADEKEEDDLDEPVINSRKRRYGPYGMKKAPVDEKDDDDDDDDEPLAERRRMR